MRIHRETVLELVVFLLFTITYYATFPYRDCWPATIVLLLISVILLGLEFLRTGTVVSPLFFWYAFWLMAISFGRMNLNLYPFYQTWSAELHQIILANTVLFFSFFWIGECISSSFRYSDIRIHLAVDRETEILPDVVIGILICAVISFIINVVYTGNIPQFAKDVNASRAGFILTKYYRILNFSRFVFAVVPVALIKTKKIEKKVIILFLMAILLVEEMLSGWRSFVMQALILFASSMFIVIDTNNKKTRRIVLYSASAISIFALAFFGYIAASRDGVAGALQDRINYLVYMIYLYIAPNFLNFQSAMYNVEPLRHFVYTTEAVWGPFGTNPYFVDINQSIGTFNVSTYLLQPWGDYGSIGTYLWTSVIAIVSGVAFGCARRTKSVFAVVLLGVCNCTVFIMHNNFVLRSTAIIIWVFLAWCINLFSKNGSAQLNGKKLL